MSLNDILEVLDLQSRKGRVQYTKDIIQGGKVILEGVTAHQCWQGLRDLGLIK